MTKLRISQSSLRAWRRCRYMFNLKYIEQLQPRRVIRPLTFGKALHKIIEYHIQGRSMEEALKKINEDRAKVFTSEVEVYDKIMEDVIAIMEAYFKFWADQAPLDFIEIDGRRTEIEFFHDIGNGVLLEGVIDGVVETPDGRHWITEHKSHRKIPDEDYRMSDVQTMLYADAASKTLGIKRMAGVLWDYTRSKSPTIPEVLKSGQMSKRRIDTLPSVFIAAVKRAGLDPAHYSDVTGELDDNMHTWFRRVWMPLNKGSVATLMEETRTTGREMIRKAGTDLTRNINYECRSCSYKDLCHADLMGLDVEEMKAREYRVEEARVIVEDPDD